MITNIRKNCVGTVSFDGLFSGQRKAQKFTVYPINDITQANMCQIQSDKRAGYINLQDGRVSLSKNQYVFAKNNVVCTLPGEDLMMLKSAILATASGKAGTNGLVYCDNSGALEVFAA